MADWIIYYDDGSSFSSDEGKPEDSPVKGVICIGSKAGADVLKDKDWYYWNPDVAYWIGCDLQALMYQICNSRGSVGTVRQGAWSTKETYDSAVTGARTAIATG